MEMENQIKMDKSLFEVFNNLFEGKDNKDLAFKVIKCVSNEQESQTHSKDLKYVINRVVRGLGSTRAHIQSTSMALLTCILQCSEIDNNFVLTVLEHELKTFSSGEIKDNSDDKMAIIFVCGALIQVGLYSEAKSKSINIVDYLLYAARGKVYLKYLSYMYLSILTKKEDSTEFKKEIWPKVKLDIGSTWQDQSLETLNFIFSALNTFENFSKKINKLLGPVKDNLSAIANILVTGQSAFTSDHPVFEEAIKLISSSKELLVNFWTVEIESLSLKLSQHRENRIMFMFDYSIKHLVHVNVIHRLLTTAVLKVIQQSLSFSKSHSEQVERGKEVISRLVELLGKDTVTDKTRISVIGKLLDAPGEMNFERQTGTRCIHLIILQCSADGIKQLSNIFMDIIDGKQDSNSVDGSVKKWSQKDRIYILNTLVKLINLPVMKEELDWKIKILKYILFIAFFKSSTNEFSKNARECFYNALNLKLSSVDHLIQVLDCLVEDVNANISSWEDEKCKVWKEMMSLLQTLRKKKNKNLKVIHVLAVHMGFLLMTDFNLAKENIEELIACCNRMINKRKSSQSEEPEWIEVTVDLLLSLLSKENKLFRHVISCVFPQLCSFVNLNCIQQLIEAFDPNKELDSVDSDDDNSDESDNEYSPTGSTEDLSEGKEESSDENDDVDEDEGTVNDKLRVAVREALGRSGAITDDESEDMDNMDAEEEKRLNERLGEAFKLLKSSKKPSNKKQSKEDAAVMHFRIRVLDLVDIYVNNEPSMGCCLDLLIPLHRLLEFSIKDVHQKPLQNRVEHVLKSISNVKKFSSKEDVNEDVLVTVLRNLVNQEDTTSMLFSEMSPRISLTCIFLVRCSQQLSKSGMKELTNEIINLVTSHFKGRDTKVKFNLFETVIKMQWEGNWKLLKTLFQLVFDENVRTFRKNKLVELITHFYRNERLMMNSTGKQKKLLSKTEDNFMSQFISYLSLNQSKLSNISKALETFLSNIFDLIKIAHNNYIKFRSDMPQPSWKLLFEGLNEMKQMSLTNRLNVKLLKLSVLFDVRLDNLSLSDNQKHKYGKKRKTSESNVENDTSPVKKKNKINGKIKQENSNEIDDEEEKIMAKKEKKKRKKNKSKAIAELKRQSFMLRTAASAEGLKPVCFSQATFIPEEEISSSNEEKSHKKKKKKLN